jgi:hypothetical protein
VVVVVAGTEIKVQMVAALAVLAALAAVATVMVWLHWPTPEVVVEVACTAVKHQVAAGQMAL